MYAPVTWERVRCTAPRTASPANWALQLSMGHDSTHDGGCDSATMPDTTQDPAVRTWRFTLNPFRGSRGCHAASTNRPFYNHRLLQWRVACLCMSRALNPHAALTLLCLSQAQGQSPIPLSFLRVTRWLAVCTKCAGYSVPGRFVSGSQSMATTCAPTA